MKKIILYIIPLIVLIIPVHLTGQVISSPSDLWLNPATKDFATIRQNVEQYYSARDKGPGTGYKQWKRWEYYNQIRLTPDGQITNVEARNWDAYQQLLQKYPDNSPDATNGYWTALGPYGYTNTTGWNPGIGRVNVIAFHPVDGNTFWIGMPSGGLWKTTDGGSSWIPLTDGMPRIGVSGIAVNYNNPDVISILTGDGDAGDTKSIGVLKTTDGGNTWMSTGLTWNATSEVRGYKLAIHPHNPNILFAVTALGIFKTTNGGVSWTMTLEGTFRDLEFKPGDPTYVYVSGTSTFYRSTDTGDSWTQITTGMPSGCTRIAIGVSPANNAYVYLFGGPPTGVGSFKGFYLSTNSGGSFSVRSTEPNLLGYATDGEDDAHQTGYDLCMEASRTNSANVIVGGINTWKSTNTGSAWTISSWWDTRGNTIGYTHADIHNLTINPLNNYLYCCSDGGIFRSTDFGENWTDLSYGLNITQWYRIAGYQPTLNLLIGGTQDNGSDIWTGGSTMTHIQGADGGDAMIDFTNSNILYASRQYGTFVKSTDGGATWSGIKPSGASGPFVTPYLMDPNSSTTIYGGFSNGVYKSTNGGSSWTNKGSSGSSAMAIGTNNSQRLYVASGSVLQTSSNGGTNWTTITSGLPGRGITSIAVNPDNASDVFITVGNYAAGQKVYASANAGSSWTNISGTLPNVAVICIAYEDNDGSPDDALYIGTDIGIFYRNAALGDWIPFRNGLPSVPVSDLEINKGNGVIRAATYGRGLWSSALYSTCPVNYTLTKINDPSNPNYTGFQYYESSYGIESSRTITGGVGTDVTYKAGTSIILGTGFNAREHNKFKAILGPCEAKQATTPQKIIVTGTYAGPLKK